MINYPEFITDKNIIDSFSVHVLCYDSILLLLYNVTSTVTYRINDVECHINVWSLHCDRIIIPHASG